MGDYKVIGTETYLKELDKWDKSERVIADKIPIKLANNPHVGRELNYSFLREKRVREKRIYYLIYEDLRLVLLVATSGKKDQQATIGHVKDHLKEFRKIAENIARQVS